MSRIGVPSILAAAAALCIASAANARIIHFAEAAYSVDGLTPTVADEVTLNELFEPIDRPIAAAIAGTFGEAVSSIGPAGDLGMRGALRRPGEMQTTVIIENDFIANPHARAQLARARFIIDGGSLFLIAGQDSRIGFGIQLLSRIFDENGIEDTRQASTWFAFGRIRQTDLSGLEYEYEIGGSDIGIHVAMPGLLDIPLSFQTVELGIVPPRGSLSLSYLASMGSEVNSFSEVASWRFSDPLNVDGESEFPTVSFSAASLAAPVPVSAPASLPLVVGGIGMLCVQRRRRVDRRAP